MTKTRLNCVCGGAKKLVANHQSQATENRMRFSARRQGTVTKRTRAFTCIQLFAPHAGSIPASPLQAHCTHTSAITSLKTTNNNRTQHTALFRACGRMALLQFNAPCLRAPASHVVLGRGAAQPNAAVVVGRGIVGAPSLCLTCSASSPAHAPLPWRSAQRCTRRGGVTAGSLKSGFNGGGAGNQQQPPAEQPSSSGSSDEDPSKDPGQRRSALGQLLQKIKWPAWLVQFAKVYLFPPANSRTATLARALWICVGFLLVAVGRELMLSPYRVTPREVRRPASCGAGTGRFAAMHCGHACMCMQLAASLQWRAHTLHAACAAHDAPNAAAAVQESVTSGIFWS